jgi:hypothetical protein
MAYKKRPTKTKLVKKSNVLSDKERKMKESGLDKDLAKARLAEMKAIQKGIERYNDYDIYKIDPFFRDVQVYDDFLIVRLEKENFIKELDESNPDNIIIDAYIRQIDARVSTASQPEWVPTPFPYVERGVVVAVSPLLQQKYLELKSKMSLTDPEKAEKIHVLEPGDVIQIRANHSQWYKDHRYYIDKQSQAKDFVRNQTELRLSEFQNYFRLTDFEIETIMVNTNKKGFFEEDGYPDWWVDHEFHDKEIQKLYEESNRIQKEAETKTSELFNEVLTEMENMSDSSDKQQ